MFTGADEESAQRLLKLKDIDKNLNHRDHVEAILTEWESLVTVAKAVNSGMIDWYALSCPLPLGTPATQLTWWLWLHYCPIRQVW